MSDPCKTNDCVPAADIRRWGCMKWLVLAALLGLGLLFLLLRGCGEQAAPAATSTPVPAATAVPATEVPEATAMPEPTDEPAPEVNLLTPSLAMGAVVAGKAALSGIGTPDTLVDVYQDGVLLGSTETDGNGDWTYDADVVAGANYYAVGRTADGMESGQSNEAMYMPAAFVTGEWQSGDDGMWTWAGTGEPGSTVVVMLDGEPIGTTVVDADGNWAYSGSLGDLAPGEYLLTARMDDDGGNMMAESAEAVRIVVNAPEPAEAGEGMLQVLFAGGSADGSAIGTAPAGAPAVSLILDSSWSMTFGVDYTGQDVGANTDESQRLTADDPNSRIAVAKAGLIDFVETGMPDGTPSSLRVFGNLRGNLECQTDLMVPYGALDKATMVGTIEGVSPQFNANTTIARSLELVAEDLAQAAEGSRNIVLVTDGDETCGGDPEAVIAALADAGFDVTVNIVGFAIADDALKARLEGWAATGNGRYFDAPDADSLSASLRGAFGIPYIVLDDAGVVVANGLVGDGGNTVTEGSYTVEVSTNPVQTIGVEVAADGTTTATTE